MDSCVFLIFTTRVGLKTIEHRVCRVDNDGKKVVCVRKDCHGIHGIYCILRTTKRGEIDCFRTISKVLVYVFCSKRIDFRAILRNTLGTLGIGKQKKPILFKVTGAVCECLIGKQKKPITVDYTEKIRYLYWKNGKTSLLVPNGTPNKTHTPQLPHQFALT